MFLLYLKKVDVKNRLGFLCKKLLVLFGCFFDEYFLGKMFGPYFQSLNWK